MHTPALRIGTHFLLTLETVVFLFHLLSTTSKPFSSLSTRLAHAERLGFFYKKTRYINSLLLLLLFPAINKLHRLPTTSLINSPWSVAAKCIALGIHRTRWSHYWLILTISAEFCVWGSFTKTCYIHSLLLLLLHLHSTPLLVGPRWNIALTFGVEN